jgi:hypothetical protein
LFYRLEIGPQSSLQFAAQARVWVLDEVTACTPGLKGATADVDPCPAAERDRHRAASAGKKQIIPSDRPG